MANKSAIAVSARSPPESSKMLCRLLPRGRAAISISHSSGSSPTMRSAHSPPWKGLGRKALEIHVVLDAESLEGALQLAAHRELLDFEVVHQLRQRQLIVAQLADRVLLRFQMLARGARPPESLLGGGAQLGF